MELLHLFLSFLMVGFLSFGGGYAMIPVIEHEAVIHHGWLTASEYADAISIAGMAPGPYATNLAVFIGFHQFGWVGAILATAALVLPSFVIILSIAAFLVKFQSHPFVRSAFYTLRPIVAGLILYAAVTFAMKSGFTSFPGKHALLLMLICAAALVALARFRAHPVLVLLSSGVAGIVLFA